ncbi:N-acetylmuramoyl-L-alanine amidase, partial [Collinsella sp. CLA-JM-H32B]|uniref:N-acetylmuramoyl-L-alanine amidase n=1 Tax=Collinsella sp. CLA-JM-H32B TaxID=3136221 RepID=UPI0032C06D13
MQKSIQHYLLTAIFAVSLIFLFITHPVNAFADSSDINNLSFIYVERSHVDLGDTQRVALGFDGTPLDEPVALYCANTTSEALVRFDVTSSVDGTYLFSSSISCTGVYSLLKLEYASGATSIFPEDISDQSFSVGEVAAPYRLRSDSGSDDQPESVFTDGAGASFDSLESAVNAISENSVRARNWVFVLDAGHGGWDSGAVGNGLREKDLTLQIARYCRDELQKYAGVRVIMTRDSDASVTGVANTTNELIARAQIARDNNATLFMSFHINSGGGTGAEIWIPRQASWYSSFNELGESLGQDVLNRLASVGLVNRGTKNDYYDLNGTQLYYPDGSNADSLSVIRNCRQYGIPAVLVEHGFIDNSYDAGLLANSLYLQKMGQADALAIANQFGLSKEAKPDPVVSEMRDGKIKLSWDSVPNASKYAIALCKSDGSFNTYTYDCAGTSYEIGGLENGKTYTFLVQAYANGRWNTFTFDDYLTCKLVPSPEAQAEATGDGEVTVSWKAVAGAERYAVAERLADGSYRTYTL